MKTINILQTTAALAVLISAPMVQADTFGSGANTFTMDFVDIGDSGNSSDTHGIGYGSVAYDYRMGVHEVSRGMIESYNTAGGGPIVTMGDMSQIGGNGVNRPVVGLSWNEAARFVNWLNTSQGYQAAYKFSTGAANDNIALWTSAEAWQTGSENLFRHKDTHYFLPSENEWYKAAYYDGTAAVYYDFATGSDTAPLAVADGTVAGTAVYGGFPVRGGPADVTNAGGFSPYGTMAQNGNVFEWMESGRNAPNDDGSETRTRRGGGWHSSLTGYLQSEYRSTYDPTLEPGIGFRVAAISSVPEPSSVSLLALGVVGMIFKRSRG